MLFSCTSKVHFDSQMIFLFLPLFSVGPIANGQFVDFELPISGDCGTSMVNNGSHIILESAIVGKLSDIKCKIKKNS